MKIEIEQSELDRLKMIEEQWDALGYEIAEMAANKNSNICDIGEVAYKAFGYHI